MRQIFVRKKQKSLGITKCVKTIEKLLLKSSILWMTRNKK